LGIKAVVFDYGQVISFPQDPTAIDRMAELAGVERGTFEAALWALRGEYDRGTLGAKDYYREVLSSLRVSLDEGKIDEMIKIDFLSWININPKTVALMEDVKKAGYALGILSNMPHDFLVWARENLPVFSLPHAGIFSCEHNVIKPEEAIYRKLLSALGAKGVAAGSVTFAGEVVFFDDLVKNIRGAEALGINAILWNDPEDARRKLLSLGVNL
jgi:putative hydrolase of the HAD superfamily